VPFPGNWFGSVDELIPIHPESRSPVIELAPEAADPVDIAAVGASYIAADPVDVAAADASDFWEGDADALEEVSIPAEPQSAIALLRSPGAARRKTASGGLLGGVPEAPAGVEPAAGTRRLGQLFAVLAALVAAGVCVVLLATGALAGRADLSRPRHGAHHAVVTGKHAGPAVTITSPAVTVTTTVRSRPRHHHKAARTGTARTTSPATAVNHVASQSGAATTTPPPSTSKSSPPPSHVSATSTSSSSGSGCAAQSPDSGCLP
jgi:hypothetical protein